MLDALMPLHIYGYTRFYVCVLTLLPEVFMKAIFLPSCKCTAIYILPLQYFAPGKMNIVVVVDAKKLKMS